PRLTDLVSTPLTVELSRRGLFQSLVIIFVYRIIISVHVVNRISSVTYLKYRIENIIYQTLFDTSFI
ncbi:MAG: hypothetical protein JAY75_21555, partial [Candidatus Thiodiazotropha taylori]|nr:hypothetical protein [Candidatus Thiodiazotropha taylori]MCW4310807.1 hypothetical protein [Candidatus Thiodiazotropha endolucinida]